MPRCIKIAPTKISDTEEVIRSAIQPSTILPRPDGEEEESAERIHLRRTLGWSNPKGLYGYTKDSEYKDLYLYFDHGDKSSPVNELATKAFKMYGLGGKQGDPDWKNIRGSVVLLRIKPDYTFCPNAQYRPDISLDEMYDTLIFFRDSKMSAQKIALKRDSVRFMAHMASMVQAGAPVDPTNFTHYCGPAGSRTSRQMKKDADKCDHCGKSQSLLKEKLKKCQICKATFYCGRECQKAAWKKHKKVCNSLASE